MNEAFAIDPSTNLNSHELKALLEKFGIENSRYIADLTKSWLDEVYANLETLPDLEKKRCFELLRKNRDSVRFLNLRDKSTSWIQTALSAKTLQKVEEIISSQETDEVIHYDEFIFNEERFPSKKQTHIIPTQTYKYIEAFMPLIEMSSELILVDRYFSLSYYKPENPKQAFDDKVKMDFLIELIRALGADGNTRRLLIFFDRNHKLHQNTQNKHIDSSIRRASERAGQANVTVDFVILDNLKHWRYFFSIKGGVKLDQGIFLQPKKESELTYLSARNIEHVFADHEKYL